MTTYPLLTAEQRQGLPTLVEPATSVPSLFEDSTHQVWQCQTSDGPMMLKVCNLDTISKSDFWMIINHLFSLEFPASLNKIYLTYYVVKESSGLSIPDLVAAKSSAFVLTRYLEGDDVSFHMVSNDMATQLANHLVTMHQHTYSHWGPIFNPKYSAKDWSKRLQHTLISFASRSPVAIPDDVLNNALLQADEIELTSFSPIMIDLRWDQMLHQQGQLSAIVDMDAFVIGPTALELVLLEYQLSQEQADAFVEHYALFQPFPALDVQRYCYRLLLFLMNSLGETDLEKWMNAPERF